MNIRDLQYLIAIADHCHFGKAAEACFVSQPALSMQLKKLESTLGVQLIERSSKFILLTEAGKLITEHARDIICRVDTVKAIAKQSKDPLSGELRLGVIPTLAPYLLPYIIPGLSKSLPNLKIFLIEQQTEQLVDKLKQGKIDSALIGLPTSDDDHVTLPLFEEELLLAVPENHPLANRKRVKYSDLADKVLLLLEDGHCLRDQALSLCHATNASADKSFQATSLETLRHMVASKAGITLMPNLSIRKNDGICYYLLTRQNRLEPLEWFGDIRVLKIFY